MIASLLGRLDGTIVNLALPKIISDFSITVSEASWISAAYIIANAIFVPVFGKLGDLIGRKPLYIFGIVSFTITSMLAGLSFNLSSMIFFRLLQAITVSIDYPIALSIIAFTFADKRARAQALGISSGFFAAAIVFCPVIGGLLVDFFGCGAVFYVNVPLGIIGAICLLPIIAQSFLGYSVTKSGYLFIPMAVCVMAAAQGGARLSQVIPPRFVVAGGMFFSCIMLLSFIGIDIKWTFWDITWRLGLFAAGLGIGLAPLTSAATSTVPLHEVG